MKVQGSTPDMGEIFRTLPDLSLGPPNPLYSGYPVSFPGLKRQGRGLDRPPTSSAVVNERVELQLPSPFGYS